MIRTLLRIYRRRISRIWTENETKDFTNGRSQISHEQSPQVPLPSKIGLSLRNETAASTHLRGVNSSDVDF